MNPVELSIFSSRIESVCDEMGAILQRAAFSPNIKDRLDYSCAVFSEQGELVAQAAHIPVHLGSMAYAMKDIVGKTSWEPGDMVVLNDPYQGGTHLPDVTVIAPVFCHDRLIGFVANRAHHANIGASSPGSMPISSTLQEEGVIIAPTHLIRKGQLQTDVMARLMACEVGVDQELPPTQALGDFSAQISANRTGVERLQELVQSYGPEEYFTLVEALFDYAQRLSESALRSIPDGCYRFTDYLDDDGQGNTNIAISITLTVRNHRIEVDFTGTSAQVAGNVNCPLSVAAAAVFYVFRCLMPEQTPGCAGAFRSLSITAPQGCLVNAEPPAAVAAGNVETSTRIVDVLTGALAQAVPELIPAASHGSMNNVAMGYIDPDTLQRWDYYETIGGGMGASAEADGLSAVQTHMTNTLNTPVESLEAHYPLRVTRYAIRRRSGGEGIHRGGDGIERCVEFLGPAQVSLLTERRLNAPWGVGGAQPGLVGENLLNSVPLPGKVSLTVTAGDLLTIKTPGGGGWSG